MDVLRHLLKISIAPFAMLIVGSAEAQMLPVAFHKNMSSPGQAAIQSGLATLTNTAPANCTHLDTFPILASGAGNSIVIGLTSSTASSSNVNWVVDNAGNNYVQAGNDYALDATNVHSSQIWFSSQTLPGATSVSICSDQFNPVTDAWYMEVAGNWDIGIESSNPGGTSSTTMSATNVTTGTNKDFVVSVGAGSKTISSIKAGNNFTPLPFSGKNDMAYLFPAATGSYGAQWTMSASGKSAVSTVAFKPGNNGLYGYVQQAFSNPLTTTSPVSAIYPKAQSAGNLNIVSVGWQNATSTVSSVVDSKGNTYQLAVGPTRGTGLSHSIYYAVNIAGAAAGSNTVTVTFSGAVPNPDVSIFEYRANSSVVLDVSASDIGTGSQSSASLTPNYAKELIFSTAISDSWIATVDRNWGSAFLPRQQNYNLDISMDMVTDTVQTYSAKAVGSGSFNWVQSMAAFVDGSMPKAKWLQATEVTVSQTASTVQTPAFASNTTSGNTIICAIGRTTAGTTVTGVTDSAGNTYTRALTSPGVKNAGTTLDIWYKSGIVGGSAVTVTAAYGASVFAWVDLTCHEYSGLPTSGALDKTASSNGNAGNFSIGPVNTAYTKELGFAYLMSCVSSASGTGFATRSTISSDLVEEGVLNGITNGYTMTGTSAGCWDAVMTTFKSN